jgi:hypothetical protein
MKKTNKTLITLTIVAAIVLLAIPTNMVFAQEETPSDEETQERPMKPQMKKNKAMGRTKGGMGGAKNMNWGENASLDRVLDRLVDRYEDIGYRIQDTDDTVQRLENQIEDLIELGEDPYEVETILQTFLDNMALVEDAYAEVGVLIDAHEGFDDEGEVIDEEVAMATLRSIAEGLLEVHQLGEDVRFDLRWDRMAFNYRRNSEDE